jgi:hypothetical protein
LLLIAIIHSAGIQDRDGGVLLFSTLFGRFPFLEKLFADSAYQGTIFATAIGAILPSLRIENCKAVGSGEGLRNPAQALDRRKVNRLVEPLSQARQGLGKSEPNRSAFLHFASIRLMLRKLCNPS